MRPLGGPGFCAEEAKRSPPVLSKEEETTHQDVSLELAIDVILSHLPPLRASGNTDPI